MTSPRPVRFYVVRAAFATGMFILMWTAWQALVGWREVRELGTLARFGGIFYLLFALIQLTLILFFAPLSAATAVALEKDRRTFVLLLMTDLSDLEIVLGKLVASFLQIVTVLVAGLPVLAVCALLGGISAGQVVNLFAVTAASGFMGASLGLLIAIWRERTFQSISLTILMVVFSVVVVEVLAATIPGFRIMGVPVVEALNPYRAMLTVLYPASEQIGLLRTSSLVYVALRLLGTAAIVGFATRKLRVWNPPRNEPREARDDAWASPAANAPLERNSEIPAQSTTLPAEQSAGAEASNTVRPHRPYRSPWSNPVLWRELRTSAYGSKPLVIKGVFLLVAALIIGCCHVYAQSQGSPSWAAWSLLPVTILSILLVNAQGVTSLTSERDTGALDLLLVTELSPKQFIYGKLYGALYNVKEMVALPVLMALYYAFKGYITGEECFYIVVDFLLLCHFAAMLGLHAAITYTNSRTAVAHSLGVCFFLMVGILICAFLIMLSNREFGRQLLSFMVFIGVGSVALFGSLGARNPSQAIALVSILTPFWSFFCIISLLRGDVLAAFLFSVAIYGFALAAMLVPAVSDFDIALGRTNAIQG